MCVCVCVCELVLVPIYAKTYVEIQKDFKFDNHN